MKKLLALLLAVVMIVGLVACTPAVPNTGNQGTGNNNNDNQNNDDNNSGSTGKVKFPLEEEVVFKLAIASPGDFDYKKALSANILWQDLYEATNVRIEIVEIPPGDRVQGVSMAMMSGTIGDVIATSFLTEAAIIDLASAGNIIALNDYVNNAELMPNLNNRVFAQRPEAKGLWTCPDGNIYQIGSYNANISASLESSLWINKNWCAKAKEANPSITKSEDGIPTTFAELEALLKYFADNDMNGNGIRNDEVPYLCYKTSGYQSPEAILGMWGIPTKDGTMDNYVYVEDGQVIFAPASQGWKDWAKTLNKWYNQGIVYEDVYADEGSSKGQLLYTGTGDSMVGMMTNDVAPTRNSSEYVSIVPPAAPGYTTRWYLHPGYMGGKQGFAVTKYCKEPEILMAWLDLFYTWDVGSRNYYGEKGSVWQEETADGKITQVDVDEEENKAQQYTAGDKLWEIIPNLPYAFTQEDYDKHYQLNKTQLTAVDAYEKYKDIINDEVWPRPYIDPDDNDEIKEISGDLFTTVYEMRAKWLTGKGNVDAEWQTHINNITKVGYKDFVDILQDAYDTFMEGQGK